MTAEVGSGEGVNAGLRSRSPARPDRSAARKRTRRSRARRRKGKRLLRRVEVDEHDLVETLQDAGKLSLEDGLRWDRVELAVGRFLADWILRWRSGVTRGL